MFTTKLSTMASLGNPSTALQSTPSRVQRSTFWLAVAFVATSVVLSQPGTTQAELIMRASDVEVSAGDASHLDVFFEVPSGNYALACYQIEVILNDADSGIHFTGLAEPENAVFPGQLAMSTATRPGLPGPIAAANDMLPDGEKSVTNGAGLLRLLFETEPDCRGVYEVIIDANILRTNLSDGVGNLITVDQFVPGSITVVPEPSSLFLLCVGAVVVLTGGFLRRPAIST